MTEHGCLIHNLLMRPVPGYEPRRSAATRAFLLPAQVLARSPAPYRAMRLRHFRDRTVNPLGHVQLLEHTLRRHHRCERATIHSDRVGHAAAHRTAVRP